MPTAAPADPRPNRIEELTRAECFGLLAGETLGRVAVTDDYGPVVFPVNFVLDRHTVVFRTEPGARDRYLRILPAVLTGRRIISG